MHALAPVEPGRVSVAGKFPGLWCAIRSGHTV